MKPTLKAPGANLLTLKCDKLLSSFAFKFNLRRYNKGASKKFVIDPHNYTGKV